jgi:4-amino-4-deoxy-L-arabinose transferase-like glycosyltransferase
MLWLSHHPTAQSKGHSERVALLLICVLAFALRIVALGRLGLAYDEAASAMMARATPGEIIAFHWNAAFEHPPLWALLLHGWSLLAGQSEFVLRTPPAFSGTLIVVMTWRLVLAIWRGEHLLALLSALLVALSPVLIYYSQEARMYTLVVLLMLATTYLALRLRFRPTWRLVFAFWLASWLMLGLHYFAALALAIQAAVFAIHALVSRTERPTPWGSLFVAYLGALLPVVTWMILAPGFRTTLQVVLDQAGEKPVSWQYFLGDLWRELTFGSIRWQPPYAVWGYAVAPLVMLGALLALLRPANSTSRLGAWLLLAIVLLPVLSGTLALRTLVPRYILWIAPLFYILAALPAALLWRRFWLGGLVLLLVALGVDLLALQHYFGPYRKSEYREMSVYLQNHGDPQVEILLMEAPRQHLLAKYYIAPDWQLSPMPTLPLPTYWPVTAPLLVPEDEDDRIQGWLRDYEGLWVSYTSEAEVDRGEFLAKYLTAVSYRQHCTQWLDVRLCHYVSPHHVTLSPLTITPALFGNELALTGAQGAFYRPDPASTDIMLQLDWHAQQKPTVDYKVSLRLVDADGGIIDEANDFPIGPLLPPTTWHTGDAKPGFFVLRLPAELPAGSYALQLSLYDANSLMPSLHTPLKGETRAGATTEPLILAEVQVGDTMGLLSPAAE